MKLYTVCAIVFVLFLGSATFVSAEGFMATEEGIKLLKEDLAAEKLQVGKTRLYEIRKYYGEPEEITEDGKKVTFVYGDLKIEFSKKKILLAWEYDTFKDPVYTDDTDKLRQDLESKEIDGNNISYTKIVKDYGEPTDTFGNEVDGMQSIFYYGDIKLIFENIVTLKKYRIKGVGEEEDRKDVFISNPREVEGLEIPPIPEPEPATPIEE